jgi:hypothetical protein
MKKALLLATFVTLSCSQIMVGADLEKSVAVETPREKAKRAYIAAVKGILALISLQTISIAIPSIDSSLFTQPDVSEMSGSTADAAISEHFKKQLNCMLAFGPLLLKSYVFMQALKNLKEAGCIAIDLYYDGKEQNATTSCQ